MALNSNSPTPGHSLGNVENNFRRQISPWSPERQQQDYLQNGQNESVDQGNFRYHFRGIESWGGHEVPPLQLICGCGLELDDASANTNGDRLSTVIGAEFLHDVFDVDL